MEKLFQRRIIAISGFVLSVILSSSAHGFELLSEGAMGDVSAISANSAEEIINVIGSTAAGLRVDDDYDELPFEEEDEVVGGYEVDEVSSELDFALTKEVEGWANDLSDKQGSEIEVGYVDELPASTFEDVADFVIQPDEFENIIYDTDLNSDDNTLYQVGRVDQTVTVLSSGIDSIQYILERHLDHAATIDSYRLDDDTPSMGSGYITDLHSISNVTIAKVRK
mgnify:CR=1 FL=1